MNRAFQGSPTAPQTSPAQRPAPGIGGYRSGSGSKDQSLCRLTAGRVQSQVGAKGIVTVTKPFPRQIAASYLLAAPLPHAFSILSLITSILLMFGLFDDQVIDSGETSLFQVLGLVLSLGVFLCATADGFCRYLEYRRFKQLFRRFGIRPKLIRVSGRSRCQRDAMLQAARECGLTAQAIREFQARGYRWYHLLPDQIAANPLVLFHPGFLRSTFWPG